MTTRKFYNIQIPTLILEAAKDGPPKIIELVPTQVKAAVYFEPCAGSNIYKADIYIKPKKVPEKGIEYIPTVVTVSELHRSGCRMYNGIRNVTEYYDRDGLEESVFRIIKYARVCHSRCIDVGLPYEMCLSGSDSPLAIRW